MVKPEKRRFGIVDTAVLVGVILIAAAIVYTVVVLVFGGFDRLPFPWNNDKNTEKISLTVRMEGLDVTVYRIEPSGDEAVCDFLSVGDTVYCGESAVGTVTSVTYGDHMVSTGRVDSQGQLIYAAYPDSLDLIVTVELNVTADERGYKTENGYLNVGDEFVLETKNFRMAATVEIISGTGKSEAD